MTIEDFVANHPMIIGSVIGTSCSLIFAFTWMLLDLIFGRRRP